jgi:hypothetical protein
MDFDEKKDIKDKVDSNDDWKLEKATEIKTRLISLIKNANPDNPNNYMVKLTNKVKRNIKQMFNREVNLTDRMFQGFHTNNTEISSLGDEQKEINMIYKVFKKTPTKSFQLAELTVKKYIGLIDGISYTHEDKTKVRQYLITKGYEKYKLDVKEKKVKVKTHGLDLMEKCATYAKENVVDPILEEQIDKFVIELKQSIMEVFDATYTYEQFAQSICPVLDVSGSMDGQPLLTGFFYMLVLAKVFAINKLYYFSSDLNIKNIIFSANSTYLDIIKQIYSHSTGSTELNLVFKELNKDKISGKNIIIITDGDCDPVGQNKSNPFHQATIQDKSKSAYPYIINCNFVIINVKEKKMGFPYLNLDPQVCYLTGNNPKTIIGFIKALTISAKTKLPITPDLVLSCTLNLDELIISKQLPQLYSNIMSDSRIDRLYTIFMKNIPKKKVIVQEPIQSNNQDEHKIILTDGFDCSSDSDSDSDY